jgi:hypothetical protein
MVSKEDEAPAFAGRTKCYFAAGLFQTRQAMPDGASAHFFTPR